MTKSSKIAFWSALLLVCCIGAAFASEDPLVDEYFSAFSLGPAIQTIMWSLAYLPIFTGGLIIPMHYLQRFTGFEAALMFWIAVLWLGGLGANYIGYAVAGEEKRWLALLIATPIMFGWCLLICSRSWADLTVKEALLVAGIITVLCAPYFGPTWRFKKVTAPDDTARAHFYLSGAIAGTETSCLHVFIDNRSAGIPPQHLLN